MFCTASITYASNCSRHTRTGIAEGEDLGIPKVKLCSTFISYTSTPSIAGALLSVIPR
jgi:hypothetical protein